MPEKESGATLDSVPSSQPDPALDLEPTSDTHQTPRLDQTSNGSPVAGKRWFVNMTDPFQRHVLPLLIPPALLLVITAIVVTLGSALLLLSASQLTIGPIVIAWPVVAAALGVLVIGFGALWLASCDTERFGDH